MHTTVFSPASIHANADATLAFFCDVHLGGFYPEENLARIVDEINAQNADIVIFGGDFFDNYQRDKEQFDLEAIAAQLARIEAGEAKLAVFGNHDYGGGAARVFEQLFTAGGFTLLRNQSYQSETLGLTFFGADDYLLGSFNANLCETSSGFTPVLVCHEPDTADYFQLDGVPLMLSGHTHGGQVRLPYLTELVMPRHGEKYIKGLYTLGETQLYVSSGIGMTKRPLRLFNPPEIVSVKLHKIS